MTFARITEELGRTGPALRRHSAVFWALIVQELEERRRSYLESIGELLEPLFIMATITAMFVYIGRGQVPPLGTSPALFFATGIFPHYLFLYVGRQTRRPISIRSRFPVEQQLDHIFANTVLRVLDYIVLGILLFGGLALFATPAAIPHPFGPVLFSAVTIVMLGFTWGVTDLVIGRRFRVWLYFSPLIARSMMLVSGAFFVADFLPPTIRYYLSFNPLLHSVMLFRLGFYPEYTPMILDVRYLVLFCIFSVAVALVLERVMRRWMEQ